MVLLELTPEEALVLRNIIDMAVRAEGMRIAQVAVVLDAKILAAGQKYEAALAASGKDAAGNGKDAAA